MGSAEERILDESKRNQRRPEERGDWADYTEKLTSRTALQEESKLCGYVGEEPLRSRTAVQKSENVWSVFRIDKRPRWLEWRDDGCRVGKEEVTRIGKRDAR